MSTGGGYAAPGGGVAFVDRTTHYAYAAMNTPGPPVGGNILFDTFDDMGSIGTWGADGNGSYLGIAETGLYTIWAEVDFPSGTDPGDTIGMIVEIFGEAGLPWSDSISMQILQPASVHLFPQFTMMSRQIMAGYRIRLIPFGAAGSLDWAALAVGRIL